MGFSPFEVSAVHLAYTFLSGFIVVFGLLSLFLKERLYIGEAPIATIVGIIIGPYALNLFNPGQWGGSSAGITDEITLEVTRVVIAIGVFAVGVELPKAYMKRHWRSLFFLLGPCMVYGWLISALLIWGLVPGLTYLSSLVIAACVTPTDPILAQAVVGGKFADKHVPAHIRHLLSAESGSNDGAAFPFLYIALYLTLDASPGHAVGEWFYITWLYEVVLGIVLGTLLGIAARKMMKFCEQKRLIDRQSYVAQYVSLAVLAIGMTTLLGSDDLLAAFACGTAFAWDGFFNKATEDAVFSNVIDLLFNCACFIYIGAIIPFHSFADATIHLSVWRLVVLAICILVVRRLPVILALYKFIPDIKTFREAAFVGWFGPMGVGAIFISTLARTNIPDPVDGDADTSQVDLLYETIGPIVAFLVLASVLSHGLSIPFFSLSRRVHSITYTWSRNPSMDTRGDEPAWTTHARRIAPGQSITINRDDDPEEGDLGLRNRTTSTDFEKVRENGEDDSGGSSSSKTVNPGEEIEMSDKRVRVPSRQEEEREREEETEDVRDEERMERGEGEGNKDYDVEGGEGGGDKTPPVVEYREGHHLIIERKTGTGDEVEVEVIRNRFHEDKESEVQKFIHPQRLKHREVDKLTEHLPHSAEHAISHVKDQGRDAIDKMGLGLMTSHGSDNGSVVSNRERENDADSTANHPRTVGDLEESRTGEQMEENESDQDGYESDGMEEHSRTNRGDSSRGKKTKPPKVKVLKGSMDDSGGGITGRFKSLFGRRGSSATSSSRTPTPAKIEEGRYRPDPNLLSPPTNISRQSSRLNPITNSSTFTAEPESMISRDDDKSLKLSRTMSAGRSTAIRFAENSSQSSETAPGISAYGQRAPGFKPNPALAMFRSTSVNSNGESRDGPSVSFQEPGRMR